MDAFVLRSLYGAGISLLEAKRGLPRQGEYGSIWSFICLDRENTENLLLTWETLICVGFKFYCTYLDCGKMLLNPLLQQHVSWEISEDSAEVNP